MTDLNETIQDRKSPAFASETKTIVIKLGGIAVYNLGLVPPIMTLSAFTKVVQSVSLARPEVVGGVVGRRRVWRNSR
jgi:hypothetical protein